MFEATSDPLIRQSDTPRERFLPGRRPSVRCASCNLDNAADNKHCIRCGAHLGLKCPNCFRENPPEAIFCGGCAVALSPSADAFRASAYTNRPTAIESENAALAARCFRIVGTIVFLFQFLYFAADRAAMAQYQHFYLPST
jgi:double zinc ribbon protein